MREILYFIIVRKCGHTWWNDTAEEPCLAKCGNWKDNKEDSRWPDKNNPCEECKTNGSWKQTKSGEWKKAEDITRGEAL